MYLAPSPSSYQTQNDPHTFLPDIPPGEQQVWVTSVPVQSVQLGPEAAGRLWEARLGPALSSCAALLLAGRWGARRAGEAWSHAADPDGQLRRVAAHVSPHVGLSPTQLLQIRLLGACGVALESFCHTGWAARAGVPGSQHQCLAPGRAERLISWARGGAGKTPQTHQGLSSHRLSLRVGVPALAFCLPCPWSGCCSRPTLALIALGSMQEFPGTDGPGPAGRVPSHNHMGWPSPRCSRLSEGFHQVTGYQGF